MKVQIYFRLKHGLNHTKTPVGFIADLMADMVTSSQDLSMILIIHSLEKLTKAFHKQSLDYTVNVPGSFFYYFLGKIYFASPFLLLSSILILRGCVCSEVKILKTRYIFFCTNY